MKIVTLELHTLLAVEQHPVHMPGAIHQPIDRMPVRPHDTPPIAEFVLISRPPLGS